MDQAKISRRALVGTAAAATAAAATAAATAAVTAGAAPVVTAARAAPAPRATSVVEPGTFTLSVGSASDRLHQRISLTVS
ncbi:hypothetical protein ACWDE0_14685 [Streptomyces sp. 900105755]|uniref:hypothetical protein n=1 Tax=Streptomyces sp. Ag109_O5-10 TaxID=1855349 RepID=UPI00089D439B|nr:hypothetical protein [Streptomyces sp. Ag109_O5-10]SEE92228.1 hypothetical protein SAMN05216533_4390 [Streptomyces sp. Ag109_O5-10]